MKLIFIFALGLCIGGMDKTNNKIKRKTAITCSPVDSLEIQNKEVTCKLLIDACSKQTLNICFKKCKGRKPDIFLIHIINPCCDITGEHNPGGMDKTNNKINGITGFTCSPVESLEIQKKEVTCKPLIDVCSKQTLNICFKKCKGRKRDIICIHIINPCCDITGEHNPGIGMNATLKHGRIDCEDPGCDYDYHFDNDKTCFKENEDSEEETDRETDNNGSNTDVPTYLVRILVILLLLCIILSTITIIICKYKGKRSATEIQRDERPERGLPEEVQPQQKIITIYATANNPEVHGKQNSDHPYEEIPNAPPENIKRTVYVTLGPPPGDQQGPAGKAQQEDGTYSELAPAERESSI